MAAKKRKTAIKKRKRVLSPKSPSKPKMMIVTEQPTTIIQTVVPPSTATRKSKVWEAVDNIRQSLFYGFWIGVGLAPIGAHIISQFYCGHGETQRCAPIEFPAWLEALGIIVALIFANAAKDVVSRSAKQLFEAAKELPSFLGRGKEQPPAGGGDSQ